MALALAGCGVDAQPPDGSFNARSGTLHEELRIDGYAEDLVPIGAVAVSDDGTIALAQTQDAMVRLFTPAGEFLGGFGGRGEGPGEFMNLTRLGWLAETLWVYDPAQLRFTFISPTLELGRTVTNIAPTARPAPEDVGRVPEFPFVYPQAIDKA